MTSTSALERRPILGTSLQSSVLSLVVDPPLSAAPTSERTHLALLRRARAAGVTTFDLASARSPLLAARLLRMAFPEGDPDLVVLIGRSNPSSDPASLRLGTAANPAAASADPEVRRRVVELAARFSRFGSVVVDWDAEPDPPEALGDSSAWLDALTKQGTIAGWSLRYRPRADPPVFSVTSHDRPASVEMSLLDLRWLEAFQARFGQARGAVIVRNPFADGRLDGTRFSATLSSRGPSRTPVDLRSLHAEFDPVLRLAPLTQGHRRTLAQAALQYLLTLPWVATVVLPLPSPERWEELRGAPNAPPLNELELRSAGLPLAPIGPVGAGPGT